MNFVLINKNFLIPHIENSNDLFIIMQKMMDMTYNKNDEYCANVYIVSYDGLYITKNNVVYKINNKNEYEIVEHQSVSQLNLNIFVNNNSSNIKTQSIKQEIINADKMNTNKMNTNKMNLEKKKEEQDSEEMIKMKQLIQETCLLYEKEMKKMHDIEMKIKIINDRQKERIKKEKEKTLTNFSKFKQEYETYKKIKKKIHNNDGNDKTIPELFILKYEYFDDLYDQNKKLLDKIEEKNLDETLYNNENLDLEITNIVNEYCKNAKKYSVKFDHSWEELDLQTASFENNNSKLGSFNL